MLIAILMLPSLLLAVKLCEDVSKLIGTTLGNRRNHFTLHQSAKSNFAPVWVKNSWWEGRWGAEERQWRGTHWIQLFHWYGCRNARSAFCQLHVVIMALWETDGQVVTAVYGQASSSYIEALGIVVGKPILEVSIHDSVYTTLDTFGRDVAPYIQKFRYCNDDDVTSDTQTRVYKTFTKQRTSPGSFITQCHWP